MSEEQTYDVAAVRNWCGVTHYTGCACHEKRRDEERDALRAEVDRLKAFKENPFDKGSWGYELWEESTAPLRAELARAEEVIRKIKFEL